LDSALTHIDGITALWCSGEEKEDKKQKEDIVGHRVNKGTDSGLGQRLCKREPGKISRRNLI
jgi:hypothetical protein